MIRCDDEGVPKVVQFIRYIRPIDSFEFRLFTGQIIKLASQCLEIPYTVYMSDKYPEDYYFKLAEIGLLKLYNKEYLGVAVS